MSLCLRRREFIAGLGSAAAWPLVATAQEQNPVRRIGALIGEDEEDAAREASVQEFRKGLRELGWIEGQNIRIDWRWAAGDRNRAAGLTAELVALKPDLLFGDNSFVVAELQKATRSLPIVFAAVINPIARGFITTLARPGGNITGFAGSDPISLSKLSQFMTQIAPHVRSVTIMVAEILTGSAKIRTEGIATAASSFGLRANVVEVRDAREIESTIVGVGQEPNSGLIVPGDITTNHYRRWILTLAARYKLPVLCGHRYYAEEGGLLSYGTKPAEQYRGAAAYINRILKGDKPADLPVVLPTKFELVLNLKTAKELGLTVPPTLFAFADAVIE
jgi:putative ABC transport system substrate-binding protein